jgi:phage/plasmid-like protein (TIGR03299 family)
VTDNILGQSFVGRQTAWHHLGTVIPRDQPLSVMDAMVMANANYRVELQPVTVDTSWGRIDTGKVVIVREPIPGVDDEVRVLGVATENYQVVQNFEFGQMVGDLAEREGWPLETVGVLGKGELFFISLLASSVEIKGDGEVDIYFLISEGKDGGTATKIVCTPVRVVCKNTLIMGLQQATMSASVQHRGDVTGELQWNMDVVAQMKKAQDAVTAAMSIMAQPSAELDGDEVAMILEAAYPSVIKDSRAEARARELVKGSITLDEARLRGLTTKVKRKDDWVQTVREYRAGAQAKLLIFNDEYPQVANTPWAVYNAIAENEQYRKGKNAAVIARDLVFGGYRGANVKNAFDVAHALAVAKN